MKRPFAFALLIALCLGAPSARSGQKTGQHPSEPPIAHERLRLKNDFRTPEDVVRYYCGRDAAGFVWTGLLDGELSAFTTWREAPQQDSFYIAKSYEVVPLEQGKDPERAEVEVRYQLSGVGDGHGTRMPTVESFRKVTFSLRKIGAQWKIERPAPERIAPTVVEKRFPGI